MQIARSKKWELAKNEISAKLRVIKVTAKIFAKSDRVEEKIQNLMTGKSGEPDHYIPVRSDH